MSTSIVGLSNYVVATKRRLVDHFGLKHPMAAQLIESNKVFIVGNYRRGIASDRTARMLFDRTQSVRENPISNNEIFIWSGVAMAVGLGLYFLTKKPSQQPKPSEFVFAVDNTISKPIGPFGIEA